MSDEELVVYAGSWKSVHKAFATAEDLFLPTRAEYYDTALTHKSAPAEDTSLFFDGHVEGGSVADASLDEDEICGLVEFVPGISDYPNIKI
jgi:hypothetical protein